MDAIKKVLVTGGAGYVGSNLVPKLLAAGYEVKVLDLYLYGREVLAGVRGHPGLTEVQADLRDEARLAKELVGMDAVIHLACISNDPSYELNPELGKSINYDAFLPLVAHAKEQGIKRFIYASSSSVYGIKEGEVTEELPLEPLTDYSKYKALCEEHLAGQAGGDFVCTVVRPSTVCGYAPRLRLDLTVNILTNHALNKGKITVFGGGQKRPNLHMEDMSGVYLFLLGQEADKVRGKTYNVGYQNYTVMQIAEMVRDTLSDGGPAIDIEVTPSNDLRSYHVNSDKIKRELGFAPSHSIQEAILDLKKAFQAGLVPNPMTDIRYYNIKLMQAVNLV